MVNHLPGAKVPWNSSPRRHLLLYVVAGSAVVSFRSTDGAAVPPTLAFYAGQAVLVPAGLPRSLDVAPESVVVPVILPVPDIDVSPDIPVVFTLDLAWSAWILHHFVSGRTPVHSLGQTGRELIQRVGAAGPEFEDRPRGVRFPEIQGVMEALYADPAIGRSAENWARECGISVRTFHRHFRDGTGLSFADWRRECRLSAAEEYLGAGYSTGWVADRVGYGRASGFVRAFRESRGVPPKEWARDHDGPVGSQRVMRAQEQRTLAGSLHVEDTASTVPRIPGSVADDRVHKSRLLLLWLYRGTATAWVGKGVTRRVLNLTVGDAVWIPAGTVHKVVVDPESVLLPLDFDVAEIPDADRRVRTTKIPPSGRDEMLRHTIANLTAIKPGNYDRLSALDIFDDSIRHQQEMVVNMPSTEHARTIASVLLRNLRDDRDLGDWASDLGTDAKLLDRAFREQTGRSFVSWRSAVRLRAAHDLMVAGTAPSAAARRVGYRHLSGFSRDFSRHYGVTPREFMGT